MTTDKELLELAAKAAGYEPEQHIRTNHQEYLRVFNPEFGTGNNVFNPLYDDGDALRLAVKLQLNFNWEDFNTIDVWCSDTCKNATEEFTNDPYAATRRAIVRAAAHIGEGME